ncbi:GGDEF domain-containing protein [Phreatobacter aquaticus]|uniref:diguanylate cyclase n=1 Tax=Phreatobacter aquaticus TaxID=2570229 RepID=A0A4D7QKD4_9HYPH|nr:GGDEF domain-containing protein [Phreatobacter aquaticus]QCK86443.1 GGDEF domain-containing protein [Phreatobacter aquaticus]
MPTSLINCWLLLGEALLYFGVMAVLFRLRHRTGLGLMFCALGVMHFLETYLASVFYVALPFGIISPGSTVLFSGKLVMLLLIYMREDAVTVRQPIYGLLAGNFLMVGLVLILRLHEVVGGAGRVPDIGFIDEMGWLMVWGTTLLYVDAIAIILLYEKLGQVLKGHLFARVALASCAVLTFDQIGFFAALHWITGAPVAVLFGGWFAKMAAALVFSALVVGYLRWFETVGSDTAPAINDVFDLLTYRERYHAALEQANRDGLTGLQHRGSFEKSGEAAVAEAQRTGRPLSLMVIDVDHFKAINDRRGHASGDQVLKTLAGLLTDCVGENGQVFRIGGEEFAILAPQGETVARLQAEMLRQHVAICTRNDPQPVTVSIGVASVSADTSDLLDLFSCADRRLYRAKAEGRDRVVAADPVEEAELPAQAQLRLA